MLLITSTLPDRLNESFTASSHVCFECYSAKRIPLACQVENHVKLKIKYLIKGLTNDRKYFINLSS